MKRIIPLALILQAFQLSSALAADAPPEAAPPTAPVAPVATVAKAAAVVATPASHEDWKGPLLERDWGVGFVGGLGLIEPKYGVALQAQVSKRIIPGGFIPDLTNPVFVEFSAGPVFVSGNAPFTFSGHLRWDFEKNSEWVFFALGGLGGQITGPELGDRSLLYVRLGVGAFYHLQHNMSLRMEVSHELMGAGLAFDF